MEDGIIRLPCRIIFWKYYLRNIAGICLFTSDKQFVLASKASTIMCGGIYLLSIPSIKMTSTVTLIEHVAMFPDASVAVNSTSVVSPTGNSSPGPSGEYVTIGEGSALSVTVTSKVTVGVSDVTETGHCKVGGWSSGLINSKLHDLSTLPNDLVLMFLYTQPKK